MVPTGQRASEQTLNDTEEKISSPKPRAPSSNMPPDKALGWRSVSPAKRGFHPDDGTPGELVGLPSTDVFEVATKLLPCSPRGETSRAVGSRHKQTSLLSTGQMSWKQSLRKMKIGFSRPLSPCPFGQKRSAAVTRFVHDIAHQGPDYNHTPIASRQPNSHQMVVTVLISIVRAAS